MTCNGLASYARRGNGIQERQTWPIDHKANHYAARLLCIFSD